MKARIKALTRGYLSLLIITLAVPLSAQAANVAVVGGTYGSSCNSGGYFTPSAVTVNSGDTITFSVPSNDPYAGGLQVHGFPEGDFVVARGGTHTTAALTANVSYNGSWPYSGCPKGSGSVTVKQPATPAPVTPTPAPAKTTTSNSSTSKSSVTAPTPTLTPSPSPTTSATPSSSPTTSPSPTSSSVPAADSKPKSGPGLVLAASTGAVGLIVLIALGAAAFWLKRKLVRIPPPPSPAPPPPPPPTAPNPPPTGPSVT